MNDRSSSFRMNKILVISVHILSTNCLRETPQDKGEDNI